MRTENRMIPYTQSLLPPREYPYTSGCFQPQVQAAIDLLQLHASGSCTCLLKTGTQWGKSGIQFEVIARLLCGDECDDSPSGDVKQVVCMSGISDCTQKKDFNTKFQKAFETTEFEEQYRSTKREINSTKDSTRKNELKQKLKRLQKKIEKYKQIKESNLVLICFRPELKKHIDQKELLPLNLTGRIYFIWDEIHHTEETVCVLYQFLQMYNLEHYLHIGKRSQLPKDCPPQHSFLLISATPEAIRWHIHNQKKAVLGNEEDGRGEDDGSLKLLALPSTSSEIPILNVVGSPGYYGQYEQYKDELYHPYSDDNIETILTTEIKRMNEGNDGIETDDDSDDFVKKTVKNPKFIIIYTSGKTNKSKCVQKRIETIEEYVQQSAFELVIKHLDSKHTLTIDDLYKQPQYPTLLLVDKMLAMGITLENKEFIGCMIIASATAQGTSTVQRIGRGTGWGNFSHIQYYIPTSVLPEVIAYALAQKEEQDQELYLTSTTMRKYTDGKDTTRPYKPAVPITVSLSSAECVMIEELVLKCFASADHKNIEHVWREVARLLLDERTDYLVYQRASQKEHIIELLQQIVSGKDDIKPSVFRCTVLNRKNTTKKALQPTVTNKEILYTLDGKRSQSYINNTTTVYIPPAKIHLSDNDDDTKFKPFTVVLIDPKCQNVPLQKPLPEWTKTHSVVVFIATDYNENHEYQYQSNTTRKPTGREVWNPRQATPKRQKTVA